MGLPKDPSQSGKRKSWGYNLVFSIFCFLVTTTLFLLLLLLSPSDRICIAQSAVYKRAIEGINYEWVNFGDYFYPSSVYRHASPERDLAWEKLMNHDVISISENELSALQQSPDISWKQLADGGRAAVLGGQHQMNCLNLLRRHSHMELEDPSRTWLRNDVDRCIELLRHQLMCAGDVTPFLELSVHTFAGSKPDLRTMHKCRRYGDLKDWMKKNSQGTFYAKWEMEG
ncbi:hypothetical protein OIDMADRAFT_58901 [Oidiodendron maius Zn]|uniref:Uncharacterized protein n=1 Tax=Oidiodendron maius (strain Zn) TaxID=913774 RepID=A0A0C3GKE8_OIDMZ|nr:hypothetical protein OIDMADRAFT_58901 [Oidiodendron maius Zn]